MSYLPANTLALRPLPAQQAQSTASTYASVRSYADQPVGRPKQHTGRPAAKTPRAAASRTAKKAAPKKAAAKTKKPAAKKKKPARKTPVKKPRKVLTPEQIERKAARAEKLKIAKLKAESRVKDEPKGGRATSWTVYLSEQQKKLAETKGHTLDDFQKNLKAISAAYQNFTPSEREHYNHVAVQENAAAEQQKLKWIQSLTPTEVRLANNARANLTKRGIKGYSSKLSDERIPQRPRSSYLYFSLDRMNSGDLKGVAFADRGKLIGTEWKALPAGEKKVC